MTEESKVPAGPDAGVAPECAKQPNMLLRALDAFLALPRRIQYLLGAALLGALGFGAEDLLAPFFRYDPIEVEGVVPRPPMPKADPLRSERADMEVLDGR